MGQAVQQKPHTNMMMPEQNSKNQLDHKIVMHHPDAKPADFILASQSHEYQSNNKNNKRRDGHIPSYIISQMRKDLILSNDVTHLNKILKMIRDTIKRACADSKRTRKETFKLLFNHHDLFSISTPLLFSDSNDDPS